jgi:acetoin utilization deacetylase AcuC-like enzyme
MATTPILVEMHPDCEGHLAGRAHPERPERLAAVRRAVDAARRDGRARLVTPRPATRAEITRVHHPAAVDAMEAFIRAGGRHLDADTGVSPGSWDAALAAAGAGLDAVERLQAGEAGAAFVAVRPPGHHATPERAMGFCLLNNVAITAAALADAGERVLIVDFDAHHGNGTQDAFYRDGRVSYVSLHQWPLYPGTGRIDQTGEGDGAGATVNLPLPAGATGDVYLAALDEVVAPIVEMQRPTWLMVSAGFDGHRADPLTDLGLSAGDFADITARLLEFAPPGRRLVVLEGGYDLDALTASTEACLAALAGVAAHPERPTGGGPGRATVERARRIHLEAPEKRGQPHD